MGIGAATLALAVLGVIAWLSYLVNQSRVRRRREAAPKNLSPFLTDDELESKRLNGVLISALIATVVIAIVMPIYYLNESDRQVSAGETFDEIAIERGEHWFEEFQCGNCHGADGGGGGASFVEARSGISTAWAAPALNDVLYRFDESELRYWIVFGRQGTPMPSWGVEGGGPLNSQQVDELIAYIRYIQIPQMDAVAEVDGKVSRELTRLMTAEDSVAATKAAVEAEIAALTSAPEQYAAIEGLSGELEAILSNDESCTDTSAALVGHPCGTPGIDRDRDGLTDLAEIMLKNLVATMIASAPESDATAALGAVAFDPSIAYTTSDGSTPIPDLDQAKLMVTEFETIERNLRLTLDSREAIMATLMTNLEFVTDAEAAQRWKIDFEQIAADGFDGNLADAQRGAALFNAYCARCHTAGYSAGVAFTQEAGSGALGPSLREGKAAIQFPDPQDHLDFIIKGTVNGQAYGINGIGRGWMPGFGTVLSERDLMLIVNFERALR